jgi:Sec-independent protein translocase protein TatA
MAPELKQRLSPLISRPWWAFAPFIALVIGTTIFLLEALGVRLPAISVSFDTIFVVLVVAMVLLGAFVVAGVIRVLALWLIEVKRRREKETYRKATGKLESLLIEGRNRTDSQIETWTKQVNQCLMDIGEIDEGNVQNSWVP